MAFNYSLIVVFPVVTVFWLIIGAVVPWFVRGSNKGIVQTMIVTTAICCYLFYLIAYLAQLNPLIGPVVKTGIAGHMRKVWSGQSEAMNEHNPCYPAW